MSGTTSFAMRAKLSGAVWPIAASTTRRIFGFGKAFCMRVSKRNGNAASLRLVPLPAADPEPITTIVSASVDRAFFANRGSGPSMIAVSSGTAHCTGTPVSRTGSLTGPAAHASPNGTAASNANTQRRTTRNDRPGVSIAAASCREMSLLVMVVRGTGQ